MECYSCLSLSGKKKISPGPIIYEGKYWVVEHAYPTKYVGWLVIVLKRHAEALHELTQEEFNELLLLQKKTVHILHVYLHSEKEYVACFAEADHFKHIHFHIIPTTKSFPEEYKGTKVYGLLKAEGENDEIKKAVIEISNNLKAMY